MAVDRCLPGLERKGQIDAGRSKEAGDLYRQLYRTFLRSHDESTAAALASQATVERLEAALAHKKRNLVRQANAQEGIIARARAFDGGEPGGNGPIDPRGVEAVFAYDPRAGHNDTIEARQRVIRGRAHSMITGVLMKHRADILGNVRAKAELEDLVREAFVPGSTGNANARELAGAWAQAADYLRARFNEAGGQIGKLDNWGLPQSHNSRKVAEAGFEQWRNDVLPELNRDKMIDYRTGLPFTDEALETVLRDTWEKIATDGWSVATPGATGGKMLANQHAEHRFLIFNDGDAWLRYAGKYGQGNAFDAMMSHVDTLARDIALTEILGPNPAATMKWLGDTIEQSASRDFSGSGGKTRNKAFAGRKRIERLYNEITGANRRPENEGLALAFSTIRALQTAAKLGGATLSAVTDQSFGVVARKFNGIPATRQIMSYARQLNPASAEDRVFAIRAGLIAEEYAHMTSVGHRFLGEEMTGEVARRLSNGILRASGLSWLTQAGRWAFGMDVLGHLTAISHKSFDQLDGALQRAFQTHGISPSDWDVIRATPLEVHKGAGWILPGNITDPKVADRLMQWIVTETDYAVPVADLRTRATMNSVAPRGTWYGEVGRSLLQFKSFGISLALMQGRRIASINGLASKAKYATGFFIASTIGGLAAMQLKQIADGKDPRPLTKKDGSVDPKVIGAAAIQGGGFGIYGDFLNSMEDRTGRSIGSTVLGPSFGSLLNLGVPVVANTGAALDGDPKTKTRVGADLARAVRQELPGSSLWYSRLAFNRLVADQLQEAIDPNYRQSWRAMERRAKERGQEFWWEPGETSPDRAPEVGGGRR